MFTEVKKIIVNHANQIDGMKAVIAEQKKTIYQDKDTTLSYKDGLFAKAKEKYNADRLALIHQSKAELENAYAVIFAKLEDAITAEVGMETISELQMLCDTTVSEFEMVAYAKKYAGKYKALRLLNKVAEKNKIPFTYVTDDDMVCELTAFKNERLIPFINESEGTLDVDYRRRLFFMQAAGSLNNDANNPFDMLEGKFKDFMNPFIG